MQLFRLILNRLSLSTLTTIFPGAAGMSRGGQMGKVATKHRSNEARAHWGKKGVKEQGSSVDLLASGFGRIVYSENVDLLTTGQRAKAASLPIQFG